MAKQIRIAIFPDGRVQAEVQGVKGVACTNYIDILEKLIDAEVVDSHYTPEYENANTLEQRVDEVSEQSVPLRQG